MHEKTEAVHRLDDPDFRHAEIALKRAARKAQRQAREAGLEPVVAARTTPTRKRNMEKDQHEPG